MKLILKYEIWRDLVMCILEEWIYIFLGKYKVIIVIGKRFGLVFKFGYIN